MEAWLGPAEWRAFRGADFPSRSWSVEGETLRALGAGPAVSLVSRRRFRDFDLHLEWRLARGGNSGILYKVTEEAEAPWQSGLEMQLLDNAGHPDARVPETSCGALYGLYAPEAAPACAAERFHSARIRVRGASVEHWLGGVRVLAFDTASEDFSARVARSKFQRYPAFGQAREGHIVLQHHGSDAWFRALRIERLESPLEI